MALDDDIKDLAALGATPGLDQDTAEALPPETEEAPADGPNMKLAQQLKDWIETPNIAATIKDEAFLDALGMQVEREYKIDDTSRAEWKAKYKKWLDFAMQNTQEKTYPWSKACYSLDTDILTDRGWKPVSDVQVGEMVYSRDEQGRADYYPVTRTFRHTATHVVHFQGKSIDLMVTPNHRMLVEADYPGKMIDGVRRVVSRRNRRRANTAFVEGTSFIEASEFLKKPLQFHYIPMSSSWAAESPDTVYGIDAKAYARFLGWFISEGSCVYANHKYVSKKNGEERIYATTSSFNIAQSLSANPENYATIRADLEACGFTYKEYPTGFTVHARSMPDMLKAELRSLGRAYDKHVPAHVMGYGADLLSVMLDTLIAGDGCTRRRAGRMDHSTYFTTSRVLADQVQEICQKIGMRGTIATVEAKAGGVINGRAITGAAEGYNISINAKARIQVCKMKRALVPYGKDVACVEVAPHHTVYVRRNGKALWCGNSNVIFPLITTASLQFSARAYPAIIRNRNVVKGIVWGSDAGVPQKGPDGQPIMDPASMPPQPGMDAPDPNAPTPPQAPPQPLWQVPPGAKRVLADKIGQHMSWQLLDEMPEWEPDTDKLLAILPIVGCMFRKTYFDPSMQRNTSDLVTADQLCVNYKAKSFETVPRITEELQFYPNQIEEMIRAGLFLDRDYVIGNATDSTDEDSPIDFLEQHRLIDLDEDGYAEPYIVTICKTSCKVARIVANYDMEGVMFGPDHRIRKIERVRYYTKYDFLPSPDGGIYGVGFGHLLYPLNEAINTTLNQMLDAGHLQNAGGGFIGTGLSMHTGSVRFQIGEYKPVNNKGGPIRDSVFPIPFQGPNPVLFQMLGFLVKAGNDIGSVKDILTGDGVNLNTPATTILAMIEQGMQVFSAIYKRVHRSLKAEFAKLYRLNRLYLQFEAGYQMGDEWKTISPQDYAKGSGVEPISDPKMVSDMQRLGRAQFLMGFMQDPYFDGMEIRRRVLDAANVEEPDKLLKGPPPPPPQLMLKTAEMAHKQENADKRLQMDAIRADADIRTNASMRNAQSIREIAEAIEALARAASLSDDNTRSWYLHQIDIMRSDIDELTDGQSPAAGPSGDAEGSQPGGLPAMAPQPGQQAVPPVPAGL